MLGSVLSCISHTDLAIEQQNQHTVESRELRIVDFNPKLGIFENSYQNSEFKQIRVLQVVVHKK